MDEDQTQQDEIKQDPPTGAYGAALPDDGKPGDATDALDIQDPGEVPTEGTPEPDKATPTGDDAGDTSDEADGWAAVLERGRQLSMPEERLRALGSPEAAQVVLDTVDGVLSRQTVPGATGDQKTERGKPPMTDDEYAELANLPEGYEIDLGDDYDEQLVGQMKGLNSHVQKRIKRLEVALGEVVLENQRRTVETQEREFDQILNDLGDDYTDLFGSGRAVDLKTSDPAAYGNRDKVWREAGQIANYYVREKQPVPQLKELVRRAVNNVFGERSQLAAKKRAEQQTRNRRGQFTARPTGARQQGGGGSGDSTQNAINAVRQKLREMGTTE